MNCRLKVEVKAINKTGSIIATLYGKSAENPSLFSKNISKEHF